MTKPNEPRNKGGRPPIPEDQKLVPLHIRVHPKTRARFLERAKELGMSQHKTLLHLLDNEKQ